MKIDKFINTYRKYLRDNYDAERAVKEKAYLYSDLKHYGLSTGMSKKFLREHKDEITALSKTKTLQLVRLFWKQPSHEERSMALKVLNLHKEKLNLSDMPLIEKLMRESKGWGLLDNLVIPIMPVILEKDKNAYAYLKKWIKDDDFWVRRSALLAQLLFFRKEGRRSGEPMARRRGDKGLFFKLAESQFDESWIDKLYKDTETKKRARFFIRKAIGWTLREMSLKDPKSVIKFVKKNKDKMSGLTYREATRKLSS